jgi:hypothetical protein
MLHIMLVSRHFYCWQQFKDIHYLLRKSLLIHTKFAAEPGTTKHQLMPTYASPQQPFSRTFDDDGDTPRFGNSCISADEL